MTGQETTTAPSLPPPADWRAGVLLLDGEWTGFENQLQQALEDQQDDR